MRKYFKVIILMVLFMSFSAVKTPAKEFFEEYVSSPDSSFKWEKCSQMNIDSAKVYELTFTSQEWEGILWNHHLIVVVPDKLICSEISLLFITGSWGENNSEELSYAVKGANLTGGIVSILFDVPNQPLFGGLREDALISYTFEEFIKSKDPEWPLLLPMTKSAVKAMDVVQQFTEEELKVRIEDFVVTGASKRGWTAWLTGVVDSRVKGIIPMVYDNLNISAQLKHQIELWGEYSYKISDYTSRGLMELLDTPAAKSLITLVDPYCYREKLIMPKLIINATNDKYWTFDALNLYYKDLPGENYIFYLPNASHGLEDVSKVLKNIVAFFFYIRGEIDFPKITWNFKEIDNSIKFTFSSNISPYEVRIWSANSESKNFSDSLWTYKKVISHNDSYITDLKKPSSGYIALFGEAVYKIKGKEFYLSTTPIIR